MSDMSSKLSYELTRGVTATREGLEFETGRGWSNLFTGRLRGDVYIVCWSKAAERLRYREGEPWCVDDEWDNGLICDTTTLSYHGTPSYLHRLAAILCDGADEFRVLHWCIHNMPND